MLFMANNKMSEFIRYCREINPDKNGVITVVEIDDILRILYEDELEGRDLSSLYEPFCQIQNKILINYRAFRDSIVSKIKQMEGNFSLSSSLMTTQK